MDNYDQLQPEWLKEMRISKWPLSNVALHCLCDIAFPPFRGQDALHGGESGIHLAASQERLESAVNHMDAAMDMLQDRIRLRRSRVIRARVARSLFVMAGVILCIAIWQSDLRPTP